MSNEVILDDKDMQFMMYNMLGHDPIHDFSDEGRVGAVIQSLEKRLKKQGIMSGGDPDAMDGEYVDDTEYDIEDIEIFEDCEPFFEKYTLIKELTEYKNRIPNAVAWRTRSRISTLQTINDFLRYMKLKLVGYWYVDNEPEGGRASVTQQKELIKTQNELIQTQKELIQTMGKQSQQMPSMATYVPLPPTQEQAPVAMPPAPPAEQELPSREYLQAIDELLNTLIADHMEALEGDEYLNEETFYRYAADIKNNSELSTSERTFMRDLLDFFFNAYRYIETHATEKLTFWEIVDSDLLHDTLLLYIIRDSKNWPNYLEDILIELSEEEQSGGAKRGNKGRAKGFKTVRVKAKQEKKINTYIGSIDDIRSQVTSNKFNSVDAIKSLKGVRIDKSKKKVLVANLEFYSGLQKKAQGALKQSQTMSGRRSTSVTTVRQQDAVNNTRDNVLRLMDNLSRSMERSKTITMKVSTGTRTGGDERERLTDDQKAVKNNVLKYLAKGVTTFIPKIKTPPNGLLKYEYDNLTNFAKGYPIDKTAYDRDLYNNFANSIVDRQRIVDYKQGMWGESNVSIVNNAVPIEEVKKSIKVVCPGSSLADPMGRTGSCVDNVNQKREVGNMSFIVQNANRDKYYQGTTKYTQPKKGKYTLKMVLDTSIFAGKTTTVILDVTTGDVIRLSGDNAKIMEIYEGKYRADEVALSVKFSYILIMRAIADTFSDGKKRAVGWKMFDNKNHYINLLKAVSMKGMGDIFQEMNAVVQNSGYDETKVTTPGNRYNISSDLRVGVANDQPSGVRAGFMLLHAKSGIHPNVMAGYLGNHKNLIITSGTKATVKRKSQAPTKGTKGTKSKRTKTQRGGSHKLTRKIKRNMRKPK